MLLVLVPYIKPDLFDEVIQSVMPGAGDYPQLGGMRGSQHRGFLPTAETALFLLAGENIAQRQFWQKQLTAEHPLVKNGTVYLDSTINNEPPMSGRLLLDLEIAELLITGNINAPRMSLQFPAQLLHSQLEWHDLVLPSQTMAQVKELEQWVANVDILMQQWGMKTKLRPGLRVLFYGSPGTGKTFTATLLGKITGHEVYKVDLSMVVSKYIGETEKNLATLFDKAEHKNWILFFDEADALFGKRTQVRDAHDRYANQEVSFLLQRIETYDGLIILASNLANNVDEAFARRFEQVVHFPKPRKGERLRLWKNSIPEKVILEAGLELTELANRYEVSGGTIMNVVRHVCMQAISRSEDVLRMEDFKEGLRREYAKENRVGS
ncbi:Cell division protein FtsH [hydrothermal vent metagenome]|uniref:Cell division protein FtsH n=1 Tax=hydrothermal vent metagenome TaxID=652676 RepID=A0A3B1APX0_9ZZZZ